MRTASSSLRMLAIVLATTLLFGAVAFAVELATTPELRDAISAPEIDESRQTLLVDAGWLAERMAGDTPPVIVDLSDQDNYAAGHIPGAIHAWWQDAMDPHGAQYGMPLRVADDPPGLAAYAPDLGILPGDDIVVYDNASGEHAAWFVWWLQAGGYIHARVLDGGLAAWQGAGHEVSTEPSSPRTVEPSGPTWNAHATIPPEELVEKMASDPNVIVIDVRTFDEARDTINDTTPLGRIPGSLTLPEGSPLHADGTFLSPDEAWQWLRPLDLQPYNEVVIYGRFGTDTGQEWLCLNLASYTNVRILDGGWQGWTANAERPVEPLQ